MSPRSPTLLVLSVATVCGLAADAGAGPPAAASNAPGQRAALAGRALFARSCGACHTLTGHDTRAAGGDLALGELTASEIASFARIMPVDPALTGGQIDAVASYVRGRERSHRKPRR